MTKLQASIIICVYTENRWKQILAAVQSVRLQTVQPYELIIVVDHNTALYDRLIRALPDVTIIENIFDRGLSGSRNTGIAKASADIVAFLDDDATADKNWLMHLMEGYAAADVVAVGGLTLPKWETKRPRWFPKEFDWTLGCSYVGMPDSPAAVRNLMGGNASFRRDVFNIAGPFDTSIGRSAAKRPLGCEETEFCIRLNQRMPGSILLYDSRATIHHWVPAIRCRFSYFRSRCFAEGFSKAQVTASVGAADGLSLERVYTLTTLPRGIAAGFLAAFGGDAWGIARAGAIVVGLGAAAFGYLTGSLSRAFRRQPHAPASTNSA